MEDREGRGSRERLTARAVDDQAGDQPDGRLSGAPQARLLGYSGQCLAIPMYNGQDGAHSATRNNATHGGTRWDADIWPLSSQCS